MPTTNPSYTFEVTKSLNQGDFDMQVSALADAISFYKRAEADLQQLMDTAATELANDRVTPIENASWLAMEAQKVVNRANENAVRQSERAFQFAWSIARRA